MRSFLYETVGKSCYWFAATVEFTGNALIWAIAKAAQLLRVGYAHFCMWLLKRIDSKRVQAEKDATEENRTSSELALMAAAVSVKESSIEMGDWTEEHSHALNMIGVSLINECNWEPAAVHRYFKPLVESIEGLEYDL